MFYLAARSSAGTPPTKAAIAARGEAGDEERSRGREGDGDSVATPKLRGFHPQDEQAESIQDPGTLTHSYSGLLCVALCSREGKKIW